MPIYTYRCACGTQFDRFLPLSQYQTPQKCACGYTAEKILTPVAVRGDYPGYECPVSGKWIEGRKAHQENLARTGCRVLETGEREAYLKRQAREDTAFDAKVEETVDRFITTLPEQKRVGLFNEVAAGAVAEIIRG